MNSEDYNQKHMKNFLEKVTLFENCYRSMIIRMMLVHESDKWVLALGTVLALPEHYRKRNTKIILESDYIRLLEINVKAYGLKELCENLQEGKLILGNETYSLGVDKSETRWNYYGFNHELSQEKFGINTKVYTLRVETQSDIKIVPGDKHDYIDNLLKSNKIPFNGADDLGRRFFLLPHDTNLLLHSRKIYVWCPSLIGFKMDSGFKQNGFHLKLWADKSILVSQILVASVENTDSLRQENRIFKISRKDKKKNENAIITIEKLIPTPDYGIVSAQTFLSYKGNFISLNDFYNPHFQTYNRGIAILKKYDPSLTYFISALEGEKKEKAFEIACHVTAKTS